MTPEIWSWLEGDPEAYDAKAAGWWLYVVACGIGDPFGAGPWRVIDGHLRKLPHLGDAGRGVNRELPHLGYDTEHDTLLDHGWTVAEGKSGGGAGYSTRSDNGRRERLWLSPGCHTAQDVLDFGAPA